MAIEQDRYFMQLALEEANKAYAIGEVPIGAVIVWNGKVVATGYNRRETDKHALYHAEMLAIDEACRKLGGWRLHQCELYVTLEPCPMCAGAMINARIKRVVFGAYDEKGGACTSLTRMFELPFNHQPVLVGGVLEEECAALLRKFFKELRVRMQQRRLEGKTWKALHPAGQPLTPAQPAKLSPDTDKNH